MSPELRQQLIDIARQRIPADDPSHDIDHTLRVLANAESIARHEQADLDIVTPAALFHDLITYPKNDPRSPQAQAESAEAAAQILEQIARYPQNKIPAVRHAIELCSFSKGLIPDTLEAKILQDADGLEATGAISIMRTYASTGQMHRPFYNTTDPFASSRQLDDKAFALDLFFTRLLKVGERMHTNSARQIAANRTAFLHQFLDQFRRELKGE